MANSIGGIVRCWKNDSDSNILQGDVENSPWVKIRQSAGTFPLSCYDEPKLLSCSGIRTSAEALTFILPLNSILYKSERYVARLSNGKRIGFEDCKSKFSTSEEKFTVILDVDSLIWVGIQLRFISLNNSQFYLPEY